MISNAKAKISVNADYSKMEVPDMLVATMVSNWTDKLVRFGAMPTGDDRVFAHHVLSWFMRHDVLDRPVIIAAPPGFGKSTMLSVYLRTMVRKYPNSFGAIIVSERLDTIRALADEINTDKLGGGLMRKNEYAYYIRGFDEMEISREYYEAQFTTQANYNIVIMTTKQFELQVLKDNLPSFSYFKDSEGITRPRRTLIIDEKPNLTVPYIITSAELNELLDDIREASRRASPNLKRYYSRAQRLISQIRKQYETADITQIERINPIDEKYLIPRELLGQFAAIHNIDKLARLRAFGQIVRCGGLASVWNGRVNIQTTVRLHYEWTQYNSFVLDGTGRIDPEYSGDDFYVMEPSIMFDYSNVTFHVCDAFGLSKASIRGDAESLDNIAAECKRIIGDQKGKTLVVTHSDFIKDITERLSEEITAGKAVVKHYDGGRGSNDYVGADTAIYLGVLNKGSLYYPSVAQATVGDRMGIVLSPDFTIDRGGLVYKDPIVQEYKNLDMAVNLIQETNRIRANQKTNDINFYVFNREEQTVNHLISSYPGCRVTKYTPINRLTGQKTHADNIITYFRNMAPGERAKQSEIYNYLEISRMTFYRFISDEKTAEILEEIGIQRQGNTFIKSA